MSEQQISDSVTGDSLYSSARTVGRVYMMIIGGVLIVAGGGIVATYRLRPREQRSAEGMTVALAFGGALAGIGAMHIYLRNIEYLQILAAAALGVAIVL